MIVQPRYVIGNVIGLKLTTGEEIVGRIDEIVTNSCMRLKAPQKVVLTQNGPMLTPWLVMVDDIYDATVNMSQIISSFDVKEDFLAAYNQFIDPTPAIFMPPEKKIIT